MSWNLTKKLDSFAGPGEIKRSREVVLDPQVSPEEIKSREVELGSESWTSFGSVVTQQQRYGHCSCDSNKGVTVSFHIFELVRQHCLLCSCWFSVVIMCNLFASSSLVTDPSQNRLQIVNYLSQHL